MQSSRHRTRNNEGYQYTSYQSPSPHKYCRVRKSIQAAYTDRTKSTKQNWNSPSSSSPQKPTNDHFLSPNKLLIKSNWTTCAYPAFSKPTGPGTEGCPKNSMLNSDLRSAYIKRFQVSDTERYRLEGMWEGFQCTSVSTSVKWENQLPTLTSL